MQRLIYGGGLPAALAALTYAARGATVTWVELPTPRLPPLWPVGPVLATAGPESEAGLAYWQRLGPGFHGQSWATYTATGAGTVAGGLLESQRLWPAIDQQLAARQVRRVVVGAHRWQRLPAGLALEVVDAYGQSQQLTAPALTLCAGPQLSQGLAQVGYHLPLRPLRSHWWTCQYQAPRPLQAAVWGLPAGELLIWPSAPAEVTILYTGRLDPAQATWQTKPDPQAVGACCHWLQRVFPAVQWAAPGPVQVLQTDLAPDAIPLVGLWPGQPQLEVWQGLGVAGLSVLSQLLVAPPAAWGLERLPGVRYQPLVAEPSPRQGGVAMDAAPVIEQGHDRLVAPTGVVLERGEERWISGPQIAQGEQRLVDPAGQAVQQGEERFVDGPHIIKGEARLVAPPLVVEPAPAQVVLADAPAIKRAAVAPTVAKESKVVMGSLKKPPPERDKKITIGSLKK